MIEFDNDVPCLKRAMESRVGKKRRVVDPCTASKYSLCHDPRSSAQIDPFAQDARSKKKQVIGVSLDIKAASDNAWWPALQERLRESGCARNIYRLIQSYLQGREVSLSLADSLVTKSITKGCVQGSLCGPTFWNLILDSLLQMRLPDGCYLQAYADDVFLLVCGKDSRCVETAANAALSIIQEWRVGVKLTFSPVKTQAVCFSPASKNINLIMDSKSLPIPPTMKLLGVVLDSQLNFTHHAKYIIAKALEAS